MKKGGKKWRKQQKAAAEQKANRTEANLKAEIKKEKVDEPSKNNKKILCHHYHRERVEYEPMKRPREEEHYFHAFIDFPFCEEKFEKWYEVKVSDLMPVSDTQCRCSECGKTFPIEKIEQMEQLFKRMNDLYDARVPKTANGFDLHLLKLHKGIEPTYYLKTTEGHTELLGEETNPWMWHASNWNYMSESYWHQDLRWDVPEEYNPVLSFCSLPKDSEAGGQNRGFCNHYGGTPRCVLKFDTKTTLPRLAGGVSSLLFTNQYGICKCEKCRKVFSEEEQAKMNSSLEYLNTPHYYIDEDMSHHEEWWEVLEFYNNDYSDENEPYQLFNIEKAVELSQGIEPLLYHFKSKKIAKKQMEILSEMKWKDGKWQL